MADMYDTTCSSSSPPEPDDISLFLHQFLLHSSSSSPLMAHRGKQMQSFTPSHLSPENQHRPLQSSVFSIPDRISTVESSSGLNSSSGVILPSSGVYFPASAMNVSSSSVGTIDNDPDEYDCESEEGFEALVEDAPTKPTPPRNPSKRSRAAEVHNLSEKRRRSRINEKMKALQNLIPNSNKTDKASMLDEAIDYLKQLQLQVQMLTMRNGLSLYPMCLPGVLQPNQLSRMRMGLCDESGSLNMNMTSKLSVNPETAANTMFSLPNQSANPNQPLLASLSNIINPENSFGLGSSIQAHLGRFQLHTSSEEICREQVLPRQQLNVDHSEVNSLEFHMGAKATSSIPFDTQASDLKDNTLEACILGRDQSEGAHLTNLECGPIHSPQLDGMYTGRSESNDDIKTEGQEF